MLALMPVAELAVAEAIGTCRIGEQREDANLRPALRAGCFRQLSRGALVARQAPCPSAR